MKKKIIVVIGMLLLFYNCHFVSKEVYPRYMFSRSENSVAGESHLL